MATPKTREDIEQLRQHVQVLLDEYVQKAGWTFALKVTGETIEQCDWVYLIVVPDKEGVRAYDYAKALTDVENKLRREEHVEGVLLVPALAA